MSNKKLIRLVKHDETDNEDLMRSTIQLSVFTRKKLQAMGHKEETYDEILLRLIKEHEDFEKFSKLIQQKGSKK